MTSNLGPSTDPLWHKRNPAEMWENQSGPDGALTPLPGPNPASLDQPEERRLMPSLPAHVPAEHTPDQIFAVRMARVDGCQANLCGYVPPNLVTSNEPGRFYAHYTCPDCGHDWITGWRDDA